MQPAIATGTFLPARGGAFIGAPWLMAMGAFVSARFEHAASNPPRRAAGAGFAGSSRGVWSPWQIAICSAKNDMSSRAGVSPPR